MKIFSSQFRTYSRWLSAVFVDFLYVDFVICNHYGKNKTGTEAVLIKQSCWAEAIAAEAVKITSTKRYGIIGESP